MVSSDFRKTAREKLTGKWGKAAIISLVYVAFLFALGFVEGLLGLSQSSIGSIINAVIEIPIVYGLTMTFVKLFNSEETSATEMFSLGFSNFKRSWGIQLHTLLKLLVPIIIMVVAMFLMGVGAGVAIAGAAYSSSGATGSGAIVAAVAVVLLIVASIWITVKSYYYQIAVFIGIENPDMPSKAVVEKSKELMTGNRWKLFCLQFSFIGWAILASITLGIGYLWLLPYMIFAEIAFYKHLSGSPLNVNYSAESSENTNSNMNVDVTNTLNSNDPLNTNTFDNSTTFDSAINNEPTNTNFNDNNDNNIL